MFFHRSPAFPHISAMLAVLLTSLLTSTSLISMQVSAKEPIQNSIPASTPTPIQTPAQTQIQNITHRELVELVRLYLIKEDPKITDILDLIFTNAKKPRFAEQIHFIAIPSEEFADAQSEIMIRDEIITLLLAHNSNLFDGLMKRKLYTHLSRTKQTELRALRMPTLNQETAVLAYPQLVEIRTTVRFDLPLPSILEKVLPRLSPQDLAAMANIAVSIDDHEVLLELAKQKNLPETSLLLFAESPHADIRAVINVRLPSAQKALYQSLGSTDDLQDILPVDIARPAMGTEKLTEKLDALVTESRKNPHYRSIWTERLVAAHPRISQRTSAILAKSDDTMTRILLAQNISVPADVLADMYHDERNQHFTHIQRALLFNTSTPVSVKKSAFVAYHCAEIQREHIVTDREKWNHENICLPLLSAGPYPKFVAEIAPALMQYPRTEMSLLLWESILENPQLPKDVKKKLSKQAIRDASKILDANGYIRGVQDRGDEHLLELLDDKIARQYSKHPLHEVRTALLIASTVSPEVLREMADDVSVDVRSLIPMQKTVPSDVVAKLAKDVSERVRSSVAEMDDGEATQFINMVAKYDTRQKIKSPHISERLQGIDQAAEEFPEMLLDLVNDESVTVREHLAEVTMRGLARLKEPKPPVKTGEEYMSLLRPTDERLLKAYTEVRARLQKDDDAWVRGLVG